MKEKFKEFISKFEFIFKCKYHIICISEILISVFLCFFRYIESFKRLIASARDLVMSIPVYFCEILRIEHNIPIY